ncbi:MAG: hypothetical protein ACTSYU_02845 [Promethearchaeota archaeon]
MPKAGIPIPADPIIQSMRGSCGVQPVIPTERTKRYWRAVILMPLLRIPYPNAPVGFSLYHALLSCQENLGLTAIAKITNVSASTPYILRNKYPTLPIAKRNKRKQKEER